MFFTVRERRRSLLLCAMICLTEHPSQPSASLRVNVFNRKIRYHLSRFRIGHIGNAVVKRLRFDHQFGRLVATDGDLPGSMRGTSKERR